MIYSFRKWLEDVEHDPQEMRKIIMNYLSDIVNPKEGLTIPMRQLDPEKIKTKLNGLDLYVNSPNKDAAEAVLNNPNANLSDFIDELVKGPNKIQNSSGLTDQEPL